MPHARLDDHCAISLSDDLHCPICLHTSSTLRYTEEFCAHLVPVEPSCALAACGDGDGDFWASTRWNRELYAAFVRY
jgi:hypothetical protein